MKPWITLSLLAFGLTVAGCGGGSGDNSKDQSAMLSAESAHTTGPSIIQAFSGLEDSTVKGVMSKGTLQDSQHDFQIIKVPGHGSVHVVNSYTGEFVYTPDADWHGSDLFEYRIMTSSRRPLHGQIAVEIENVNDAPVLATIGDMMNSAESHDSVIDLPLVDIDSDELQITVSSDDPSIATVVAESSKRQIEISPSKRGSTKIHVSASDGEYSTEQEFTFSVGDVTKLRTIEADMVAGDAITFTNTSEQSIPLTFEHNGFPLFQSDEQIVQFIEDMPEQFPDEPLARKIWRFIRDNTYHNVPLNKDAWLHDSWAVLSQGWGFCSHVSAAFVHIARSAGIEARVWGLFGHVVPEAKVGDSWQMFDPDLSVYYFKPDGQLASVENLADDPSLITAPITPILPSWAGAQYSQDTADYYSSAANNFIDDEYFIPPEIGVYQPLVLPPGARFTYPGRWTPEVIGVDGKEPYSIPYYLQGQLLTRAGWTGEVTLPWMLWEIRGTGRVEILGSEYDIGSPELLDLLRNPGGQIPSVVILEANSDIRFVMFINAMRYALAKTNHVNLTGQDVWAVQVGTRVLAKEMHANPVGAAVFKKPAN